MSILVIDNYDSFAYNLVQYVGAAVTSNSDDFDAADDTPASEVVVRRNDAITLEELHDLAPDGIVVSPGPGTPAEAGISIDIFAETDYPTLGVCLGHQSLCAAHGSPVGHAPEVVHGKPSEIRHDGRGVFAGLPDTFEVGRYHSLSVEREDLPAALEASAWTVEDDGDEDGADHGVLMAVRHREKPHVGVQFHPESILTESGQALVSNFCDSCTDD
ncbi:anthranilate synthase component II [Halorussus halophilus]|uniref:anthranilate synthase component II n=1 Tax=Halorussus halophilus TaxID=2650975 RepID=UPI001301256D|nr:aminodeoxychorismate/anthranilate synthase component II [Halorussus halophilus]